MFKKLLMAAVLFIIAMAVKADDGQKIASKVQKVVVFLNGAQVTRTAMVNVSPGVSELVFGGIPAGVDEQSIQVHSNGEFTILSVKQELNYLDVNEDVKAKKVEELRAQQKILRDRIDMQNNMLAIYQNEETVLAKNQFVRPENQNLDVQKLKQALDFQTERLTALKEKEQAVNNQLVVLNTEVQKYDLQIAEINRGKNIASTNIIVAVSAKNAVLSTFTLSYLTGNASWYPSYDIRAKDVNSPLSIAYKANVMQKSGEDWKNVKLTLSTGSPAANNIKPELSPYFLNFDMNTYRNSSSNNSLNEVVINGYGADKSVSEYRANTIPVNVDMVDNQTTVEFNIENLCSISNDGKPSQVEINQVSLKADYQYYVAPKVSTDVFLTARLTDWSKYNFLPGEANLFFEGTYIGKSKIDTRRVTDTLNLSLGVDKNIIVKRVLEKKFSEKPALSSNIKETRNWLIDIRNRRNQKINLLVEDQVPVSQNALIEVEVQETSGAKPNEATGKVSWNFVLNSQDNKKLQLKYEVKYPKNHPPVIVS